MLTGMDKRANTLTAGDKLVATRRGFALGKGDTATFVKYTTGPMGGDYMTVRLDSLGSEIPEDRREAFLGVRSEGNLMVPVTPWRPE